MFMCMRYEHQTVEGGNNITPTHLPFSFCCEAEASLSSTHFVAVYEVEELKQTL